MIPMTCRNPMREHKKADKENCAARRLFFDGRTTFSAGLNGTHFAPAEAPPAFCLPGTFAAYRRLGVIADNRINNELQ